MNILSVLWVLLAFVMFAIALRGYISNNQIERQKFLIGSLGLYLALLSSFFVLTRIDKLAFALFPFFLAFGTVIPQLLARFIKLRQTKVKESLLNFRASDLWSKITWLIGIVFMLIVTAGFLMPNEISLVDGKPIYDAEYFFSRTGFLLYAISASIFFSVITFQTTSFYPEGLFHNGLFWEWSDFQMHSWKKNHQVLLLMTANNVWFPSQIKITIPIEKKEQIDLLMTQKLKKGSESA